MLTELIELNRIRLDEDRTFSNLATAIGLGDRTGSALSRLLNGQSNPQARTLHKIRRYLNERRMAELTHATKARRPARRSSKEAVI